MKTKQQAREEIRKVDKLIQTLPENPQVFTQVRLYQVLQELHFQGQYDLVCKICNALLDK